MTSTTHHKIKAEWTKASKNEIYKNSLEVVDQLEIVEEDASTKIKILEQIVIYPNQKSVKCHYCDKNFNKSYLEEHQKIHDTTFFYCLECDKKFKRKSSLRKHSYLHKGKFKYECTECKVTFIDLTKFELHKKTKHNKNNSVRYHHCQKPNCTKSFASPEYLKRHQVTHSDDFKYGCTFCDQKFKWLTSLQLHTQSIHTQNKAQVECGHCFRRFTNQRTFERHQKIHKNVKYKCTLCEKVVSSRKDNIRRHIRHLHTEVDLSEMSEKIALIRDLKNIKNNSDDEMTISDSSHTKIGDVEGYILRESIEVARETCESTLQPPIINNRVNVIQSIGNPHKYKKPAVISVQETIIEQPHETLQENDSKTEPSLKKKRIVDKEPTTTFVGNSTAKLKYDPIQHYRKMLLGFSKDDDHPTPEGNIEEDDSSHKPQVFPVHWRKRTSQNFLFRR